MEYKHLFRVHTVAIIFALLASLLAAFPQLYFRTEYKDMNQGIELLSDNPFSARSREIYDGHGFGSMYYKDGKNDPYLFQPFGSGVVAHMGKLFRLDINNTFLLSRLLLTFLVFLLIYSFVFMLSQSRLAALASAAVILPAQPVLNASVIGVIRGILPTKYWEMSQPVNPAMIYLLFFGFLVAFWIFYTSKNWKWGLVSAILLGLNAYNYFYTWTYLYAFGGFLGLIYIIRRQWTEVKYIASVFVGGLFVALPYFYNLYLATLHPNYDAVSARFAVINNHLPVFIGYSALFALVIFLLLFPRFRKSEYNFGLALLLSPIVTLNQQIITGKVLQEGHYHWYFHKPIALIFVISILFYLLHRHGWDKLKYACAAAIIVGSFSVGLLVQVNALARDPHANMEITLERQKYGPVVQWLNDHASKEEVVFTNNEVSHITVVYTSLNVFYHRAALHALAASEERLRDQLFTYYRLQGVGNNDAQAVFEKDRSEVSTRLYGLYYRDLYGHTGNIPDEKLSEIIELYRESLKLSLPEWIHMIWQKYEVAYIVWDKELDPSWEIDRFDFLTKVAAFGDIEIYTLKP